MRWDVGLATARLEAGSDERTDPNPGRDDFVRAKKGSRRTLCGFRRRRKPEIRPTPIAMPAAKKSRGRRGCDRAISSPNSVMTETSTRHSADANFLSSPLIRNDQSTAPSCSPASSTASTSSTRIRSNQCRTTSPRSTRYSLRPRPRATARRLGRAGRVSGHRGLTLGLDGDAGGVKSRTRARDDAAADFVPGGGHPQGPPMRSVGCGSAGASIAVGRMGQPPGLPL